MKAAFRRRWRGFVAGRPKASVAAPQFRTVIGRPLPLSAASRLRASLHRLLLDGPMDGECFLAWVEQMLAPTLRPGDTKRLHLRPLGVSQNESVHPQLESQQSPDENPESEQTLARFPFFSTS
jgi:hypothetical protein